ncbi:MAG: hypothetical protein PF482_08135 [Desulfobacteraceae bacterium]|jgi:hypothetical protein|nr:hypothetical protein [Desulfobacteraceae bacterium]
MLNLPESRFEQKRLKTLYRQHNVSLPGNLLVAVCVVILFWRQIPTLFLWSWFFAMLFILLIRLLILRQYESQKEATLSPKIWFLRCGIAVTANGILWGILGVYTNYTAPLVYLSIILIILAGVVAAAVAINSVSIPIFFGFALPALIPVSISLVISGEFDRIVFGTLTLLYLGVMAQSAKQSNKVILKSMTYRYEKLQLLDDLQKEKAQVMDLNKQLGLDIEKRKQTEKEKERLISELQKALYEVKTLSGLIPICAHCKKIRDDSGYWNQIESYIHKHSDVDFSHSICPDCAKNLYPDMDLYDD